MKKILTYLSYSVAVAALLTIFAHMIAASLYTLACIIILCGIAYFNLKATK